MHKLNAYINDRKQERAACTKDDYRRHLGRILRFACVHKRGIPCRPYYKDLVDPSAMQAFVNRLNSTTLVHTSKLKYMHALELGLQFLLDDDQLTREEWKDVHKRVTEIRRRAREWSRLLQDDKDDEQYWRDDDFVEWYEDFDMKQMGQLVHDRRLRTTFDLYASAPQKNPKEEWAFMAQYAALQVLVPNGQRPSAVAGMTVGEFRDMRQQRGGKWIIRVAHHKTGKSGPAVLVVDRRCKDILDAYWTKRAEKTGGPRDHHPFFITDGGEPYKRLTYGLRQLWKKAYKPGASPSVTQLRKCIATKASEECDDKDLRGIQRHMAHSPQVQQKKYAHHTRRKATAARNLISAFQGI